MSYELRDAIIYSVLAAVFWVILVLVSVYSPSSSASSVPVGVLIKAVNCPPGAMLVVEDVETGMRVDSRGKLKTMVQGLASYNIQAQIYDQATGKEYESVTTTAAMGVEINLDCTGFSWVKH